MKPNTFNYDTNEIRVITENEISWFVGIDVCNVLGYSNPTQAIEKLDSDEKKLDYVIHSSGQKRKAWTINEFGLYQLILTSYKPEAKEFKRWITHEILPSIRRAGKYSTEETEQISIENQAIIKKRIDLEKRIKAHRAEVSDLKKQLNELNEQLQENIINPQKRLFE